LLPGFLFFIIPRKSCIILRCQKGLYGALNENTFYYRSANLLSYIITTQHFLILQIFNLYSFAAVSKKQSMRKFFTAITFFTFIAGNQLIAQGRFKAGGGINYISNTYPQTHLYDYFAPSVNLSYSLLRKSVFGVAIENATSLRLSGVASDADYKSGFTTSFPLLASLTLPKINIHAGTGPAYVQQVSKSNSFNERQSGFFLHSIVGVGFGRKSIFNGIISPEYNIRLSFLKNLSNPASDGGMISFIVFLKRQDGQNS
jgi:hypothetical protein